MLRVGDPYAALSSKKHCVPWAASPAATIAVRGMSPRFEHPYKMAQARTGADICRIGRSRDAPRSRPAGIDTQHDSDHLAGVTTRCELEIRARGASSSVSGRPLPPVKSPICPAIQDCVKGEEKDRPGGSRKVQEVGGKIVRRTRWRGWA